VTSLPCFRQLRVAEMVSRDMEFRGITLTHLGMYFQELGGQQVTETLPFVYEGEGWNGEIISEEEIAFTPVFKVNAVYIRFNAENEEILEELITKYRYKTTRIGG
jgi:hypothetical protein